MTQDLINLVIKRKVLSKYLEKDNSLELLIKEFELTGDYERLSRNVTIMVTPVSARELLPIYKRRIMLFSEDETENKRSIEDLIKFCENEPDSFIKTITITSKNNSYHIYLNQSFTPICVIVGKPIPIE
jgi:hypothetical protein